MKSILIASLLFVIPLLPCKAVDPIADLKAFSGLKAGDVTYRWSADIGGNGNVVFLSTKQDYKDANHDGQMPEWTVYVPAANISDYVKLSGVKSHEGDSDFSDIAIHLDRMFIGLITQLGKKGIVTAQIDRPRKGASVGYIYAYTLEGKYMRQTLLTKYDPDKGNAIYDQYLADDKRTKVQLEEVNP